MADQAVAATSGSDRITFSVRAFGWIMLGVMLVWLVNTVLAFSFGWSGVAALFSGEGGATAIVATLFYIAVIALAVFYVARSSDVGLRADAARISDLNIYLVRAAFFAVLFVGIADAAISFMRIEGFLDVWFSEETTRALGRAAWRGPYIHVPLIFLGIIVAFFVRSPAFHWLAILIVIAELAIVITRFVFSYEQAFMGDLVRFWYAALFLFASAYTLLEDGHVRVDVFYAGFRNRVKGRFNAIGTLFFGITLCWVILYMGMGNKSAIIYSPVVNFETTQSVFGLYVKYLMAGFLGVFAVTMLIQFVAYFMESVADWRDEPGTRIGANAPAH